MRKDLLKTADGFVDKKAINSISDVKFLEYMYNYANENINDFLNEDAYGGNSEACDPLYDIEDMLKAKIKQLKSRARN